MAASCEILGGLLSAGDHLLQGIAICYLLPFKENLA